MSLQWGNIDASKLAVVVVNERYVREVTDEIWAEVIPANTPPFLFRRGQMIASFGKDDRDSPIVRILNEVQFKHILERLINPVRRSGATDTPTGLPREFVSDMMSVAEPPLPLLRGITQSPTFSKDGLLVTLRGYQLETGNYLDMPDDVVIPEVQDVPTIQQMKRAVDLLMAELLGEFPFLNETSRSHALCVLLLPFVRLMIDGPTPLHLIEAPSPGSGKTLLVMVISIPATGKSPAITTEAKSDDEWRKRITSFAIQAPQFVVIDNIRGRLDSAALSAALTGTTWSDRILGHSRVVELPLNWTWVATANNPALSAEIARRTVQIRLDAGVERPWERDGFKHPELIKWATENRVDLIWAALTLVQAWVAAGRPSGSATLGSYESWSGVMGGILGVAGVEGFLQDRERLYSEADQEMIEWTAFVIAWATKFSDRAVTASWLFDLAKERNILGEVWAGRESHSAVTAFGIALAKMRDRVFGGHRIVRTGNDRSGVVTYRLVPTGSAGGAGGRRAS